MNIFEFAEKYKISVPKTRKIAKDYPALFDAGDNPIAGAMRHYLGRGQSLTAEHLCALIEQPSLMLALGKYTESAQTQVDALRKPRLEVAPPEITAIIGEAAKGEPVAVQSLIEWLCRVIPSVKVTHSYIAVRLLLGVHVNSRQYEVPRIPRALLHCRRHEQFAGWWIIEKLNSRSITIYQKPKKTVANFDL